MLYHIINEIGKKRFFLIFSAVCLAIILLGLSEYYIFSLAAQMLDDTASLRGTKYVYLLPLLPILIYLGNPFLIYIANLTAIPIQKSITKIYCNKISDRSEPSEYINASIVEMSRLVEGIFYSAFIFMAKLLQIALLILAAKISLGPSFLQSIIILGIVFVTIFFIAKFFTTSLSERIISINAIKAEIFSFISQAYLEINHMQKIDFFLKDALNATRDLASVRASQMFLSALPKFIIEFLALVSLSILVILNLLKGEDFDLIILYGLLAFRAIPIIQTIYISYVGLAVNYGALEQIENKFLGGKNGSRKLNTFNEFSDAKDVKEVKFKNLIINVAGEDRKLPNIILNQGLHIVFGNSGVGKSTFVNSIISGGNIRSGCFYINKKEVSGKLLIGSQNGIAYCDSNANLFNGSIYQNIDFGRGYSKQQVKAALEFVDLNINGVQNTVDYQIRGYGSSLSSGQKQRIKLARAIISSPTFLILDETLNGIQAISAEKICENLKSMKCVTLFITHDKNLRTYADELIEIKNE